MAKDEFELLRDARTPHPDSEARKRALNAAMAAFDEKKSPATQGSGFGVRLTDRAREFWREMMQKKLLATSSLAGLVALPLAGYVAVQMAQGDLARREFGGVRETAGESGAVKPAEQAKAPAQEQSRSLDLAAPKQAADDTAVGAPAPQPAPSAVAPAIAPAGRLAGSPSGGASKMFAPSMVVPEPMPPVAQSRDRFETFDTNPVHSALEDPVSTFSIDVDTASYSFVRRSLKEGFMPDRDSVRVEEMINYFPYDWPGPETAKIPFNSTISVMPTPWNANTKLMHVAIKGYDMQLGEKPASNLVFLIDTSGSMNAPDKLPLLKSAFRLLVNQMTAQDTVSIVTYAGSAGTVLEPTKGSDKAKILDALDQLEAGGRTAGEAGITQAYRLAEESFVDGGVNRVMLATDGDFNVGASDDEALKRLVEKKRESGVLLSVFGFGRGNLNDQLMQTIAQNGNGAAAYIDTLSEAEKTLVEEAGSTLFPIAKDVKIQVEFNPQKIAEYRLIGYETRALKREDFNNDRVDAGDIGSGHSVTAIYEITPKGSPAAVIDDLRYGDGAAPDAASGAASDEYAFVKIRYKLPDADTSKLITTPVTAENEIDSLDQAGADQRFSVAVAAFGQKLRDTDQLAGFDYDKIMEIATAARGSDPFGYRAEFLSLVRLASALDSGNR